MGTVLLYSDEPILAEGLERVLSDSSGLILFLTAPGWIR